MYFSYLVLGHVVGVLLAAAGAWRWRDRRLGRALAVVLAGLAGALVGFDVGAQFPTGGDPHYRAIVGGIISGERGPLVGFVACASVGFLVSRRPGKARFAASVISIAAFLLATVPLADVYWSSHLPELLKVSLLVALHP